MSLLSIYQDVSTCVYIPVIPVDSLDIYTSLRSNTSPHELFRKTGRCGKAGKPYLLSQRDKIWQVDKLALTWHITGEAKVLEHWADPQRWPCECHLHTKTCWCSNTQTYLCPVFPDNKKWINILTKLYCFPNPGDKNLSCKNSFAVYKTFKEEVIWERQHLFTRLN